MEIIVSITAVSKDGTTILLVRRKESPGDIKEHASTSKGVLGCKLIDEEISLDRNTNVEIQTALHVCFSTRCIIFFMLGSNCSNCLLKFVDKEERFFETKIEPKLNTFLDNYFLKKITGKQVLIKQ